MNKFTLSSLLLCTFLTACASGKISRSPGGDSASNSNNISFGVYDISSGPGILSRSVEPEDSTGQNNVETRVEPAANSSASVPLVSETQPDKRAPFKQNDSPITARKIVRNAELNLEAETPEQAPQQITAIAEAKGGFVVESQQSSSDIKSTVRDTVVMTVRVPAERFSEALAEIRNTASRVVVETVKGQDVTEEFIDIEAQLIAKKALETQFMEIMKRANTVEDALSVQSQLADVRGEIERIEGRKRFLENQASLSTTKIRLQTAKVFAAASDGFGDRLSDAFSAGFDVALNFVLGLITILIAIFPFALFIGLPGYIVFRYLWSRHTRPKSVSEIAEEELKNE